MNGSRNLFSTLVISFLILIVFSATTESFSAELNLYISTTGNDNNPGTLEKPLASLKGARDAVRRIKADDQTEDITVYIRGGKYFIHETVVFGLEDSGSEEQTITYAAYPGEEPIFSSGVKIEGWKELEQRPEALHEQARARVWVADVPTNLGHFRTLYDGDKRLLRARSHPFVLERGEIDSVEDPYSTLKIAPGTIKNWANLEDVEILIRTYGFTMNILSLESVDEDKGLAKTSIVPYGSLTEWRESPSTEATTDGISRVLSVTSERLWGVKEGQHAVWVENVLEALNSPGEWVLNTQERKLYLWPMGDKPGDNIFAPTLKELIRVEGNIDFDGPTDTPVRGIVFRGLTFTQADRGVVKRGDMSIQHDWEMIDKGDALLRFRGAENCAVEECKFFNSGGSAIRLDLYCQRNKILSNEINHLGGAGVLLIGYGPGTKDVNKKNEVVNNEIHHCGEIYWHSHGIVLWQSGENHIAHNYIHHMPRKGICLAGVRPQFFNPDMFAEGSFYPFRENSPSIRWHEINNAEAVKERARSIPWQRRDVTDWPEITPYLHTRDNLVEFNELYRVADKGSDGSALNISGAGEGNIIRRNYIHHIYNGEIHGAIRTDDYQKKTLIEENVIYKIAMFGLCCRHENYWVNNVIVDAGPNRGVWIGERPFDGSRFVKNIFYHSGEHQNFFSSLWRDYDVYEHLCSMKGGEIDRNIYYNLQSSDSSEVESFRKYGFGKNSRYADPLFVDLENGDFRLKPESPALKMGIKSIDVREAGLTEDFPKKFR
jgi:Right handed beta helix region